MAFSIFIASSINIMSPDLTLSPVFTWYLITVPGIGATTAVSPAARVAGVAAAGFSGLGVAAGLGAGCAAALGAGALAMGPDTVVAPVGSTSTL